MQGMILDEHGHGAGDFRSFIWGLNCYIAEVRT